MLTCPVFRVQIIIFIFSPYDCIISLLELLFRILFAVPVLFQLTDIKILMPKIIDLTFEQDKTYYFRNNIALFHILSALIH